MAMCIVVTGDVVLEGHLYGVNASATASSEPRPTYDQPLGGAALTYRLVCAAAAAKVRDATWRPQGKKPPPRADERRSPAYATYFGADTESTPEGGLHRPCTFQLWAPYPARKGVKDPKDRVWRIDRPLGDGFTGYTPSSELEAERDRLDRPDLTLIDDAALRFRHGLSRNLWPRMARAGGHYVLKTTSPLCRGELWEAMARVAERLIVVVSAEALRREGTQINPRLSWEQCAEHTIRALENDPVAKQLLTAAHVVVSYRSAGALWVERGAKEPTRTYRLLFDPAGLEGDHERGFDGTMHGLQTCLAAGIAHHLMQGHAEADEGRGRALGDPTEMRTAISHGIAAGLMGGRRLVELGYGAVGPEAPAFPVESVGSTLAGDARGFVSVVVPPLAGRSTRGQWSIIAQSENPASTEPSTTPLVGLGTLTACHGRKAISAVPGLRHGPLFTVDRSEIESLRTLAALIGDYEAVKVQKKPLCIGVFGPPGAGKSFGVKALGRAILGEKAPFLEFNLSQFKSPDELIGAFHRVRDAVLEGTTPIAFWDEFDSRGYRWLQYLLAPMQDGTFQQGEITHPIGKCVFVFAGGTSPTLDDFGVKAPAPIETRTGLRPQERADRQRELREQEERYREFTLLKGPDFRSRLHGFLNVLGPNPQAASDVTWPIRRALILRTALGLDENEELDIDPGLLHAVLAVPAYHHGARSLERLAKAFAPDHARGRIGRSALLPPPLLGREVEVLAFEALVGQRDAFKNHPDVEALAAAVHYEFLDGAEKSRLEARMKGDPRLAWTIDPHIKRSYDALEPDPKASNRAAARRIPDHLALIDFVVEPRGARGGDSWKAPLEAAIETHVERIAQAEHLGWCAERRANGWTYAEKRDNERKHHPLLVEWTQLTSADQDKDRVSARAIPRILAVAGYRAVRIAPPPVARAPQGRPDSAPRTRRRVRRERRGRRGADGGAGSRSRGAPGSRR